MSPQNKRGLFKKERAFKGPATIGTNIKANHPHHFHFITGCSGFDPLNQNVILRQVARKYYLEKGHDFLQGKRKINGSVGPILELAHEEARLRTGNAEATFKVWASNATLKEATWEEAEFYEITKRPADCKELMFSPLRKEYNMAKAQLENAATVSINLAAVHPWPALGPAPAGSEDSETSSETSFIPEEIFDDASELTAEEDAFLDGLIENLDFP